MSFKSKYFQAMLCLNGIGAGINIILFITHMARGNLTLMGLAFISFAFCCFGYKLSSMCLQSGDKHGLDQ